MVDLLSWIIHGILEFSFPAAQERAVLTSCDIRASAAEIFVFPEKPGARGKAQQECRR